MVLRIYFQKYQIFFSVCFMIICKIKKQITSVAFPNLYYNLNFKISNVAIIFGEKEFNDFADIPNLNLQILTNVKVSDQ